ncbi:MAG TPA: hypothetical protein DEB23_08635 [Chitinophagaceae bacterium]|nr:hypothetical protein [Chitinophagaceae bacterium]
MNSNAEQEYLKLKEQNEKHKERSKKNYYKNHEAELQKRAKLRQDEDYKLMMAKYRASEAGKKSARITCWKQGGVISDDYDALYNKWKTTTHCEACDVELIEGNKGENKKTLDHDHKTGAFRNIVCNSCNVKRGNDDRGVVRQTKAQYNENRKWKRLEQNFRLKWDLKHAFNRLKIN